MVQEPPSPAELSIGDDTPLTWGPADSDTVCGFDSMKAANIQILKTQKQKHVQTKLAGTLLHLRPVGLSLNLTPSFLDLVEKKLLWTKDEVTASNYSSQAQAQLDDFGSRQISEKLKASNFAASSLKIGSWERISYNEGDVVAKCYYGKKKLVWEILEGRLKRKIEIQWSDILSIEAKIQENKPGILHIELDQRPTFYEEIDPQPRKNTMWKLTIDFTRGEAHKCRRHYLVFPPRYLDKLYDKLLQCDERLRKLSSKPFPSLPGSPNFPEKTAFADCSFCKPDIRFGMHFSYSEIPSPLGNIQQPSLKETPSPVSVVDFAHSYEHIGNQVIENPRIEIWGQGMNTCGDTMARALVQVNSAAPCQNYNQVNPTASWQKGTQVDPISDLTLADSSEERLRQFENQLFSDSESAYFDENYQLARVRSWAALLNLIEEENPGSPDASTPTAFEHEIGLGDLCYQQPVPTITPHNLSSAPVDYLHQQNASSMLIQAAPENSFLYQPCNNFYCYYNSSVVPDPIMESFSSVQSINGVNPWS